MRVHWSKQRSCQSVLVQQSRWFQHLPKELYECSDTRLPQGCSAMQENIEFGCAKDKDSSENTLTSGRGGKKGQELSWDRKQQRREGLAFPASMKIGDNNSSERVHFSPLWWPNGTDRLWQSACLDFQTFPVLEHAPAPPASWLHLQC